MDGWPDRIAAAQGRDGSFPSVLHLQGRSLDDANGFVTALVVRTLGTGVLPPVLQTARVRALQYLETCEDPKLSNSFRFWPESSQPDWAHLPSDADDTAIIAIELYRHGLRSQFWLKHVALSVLMQYRVTSSEDARPPWMRDGAFLTWLADGVNVVDAVVNTNVAALFAIAGLKHVSGYAAAVDLINSATLWAGADRQRLAAIAPFYPHPAELRYAIEFAIAAGAEELRPVLLRLEVPPIDEQQFVCSSAYGNVAWTAPVLQWARLFMQHAGTRPGRSASQSL